MSTDAYSLDRGIVRAVDPATGISQVEMPGSMGAGGLVPVHPIGLTQTLPGVWDAPAIGSSVFIASNVRDRPFFVGPMGNQAALSASAGVVVQAESFATNAALAASAGAVLQAVATSPGGLITEVSITSNGSANAGTATVITSGSFVARVGRRYLIEIGYPSGAQVGSGQSQIQIWRATSSQLQSQIVLLSAGSSLGSTLSVTDVPGAGSITYTFRTFTNATTFQVNAGANQTAYVRVTDIGSS